MTHTRLSFLIAIGASICITYVSSISVQEYLTLSYDEKTALDKFKKMVIPYLSEDYMKQDVYLIRWIRAKNSNVQAAQNMLLEDLRWRKQHKMDEILKEDWSDMTDDYPYRTDTHDKEGRPIGSFALTTWNIRKAAITGKMPRLQRYMTRIMEDCKTQIIQGQNMGKNVTQLKVLIDLNGINGIQHTCPLCIPFYTSFVNAYQNHYTGYTDAIILVNSPPVFKVVMDAIQPLFSPTTRRILKVYGKNSRKEWMEYLDREVEKDQRTPEFGGTKELPSPSNSIWRNMYYSIPKKGSNI